MEHNEINPQIAYDVVQLPSNGIYYEPTKKSLKVSYLTASDENILSSQNLIQSGKVIEELLRRKILDKDFDVNNLVEEDRQAILVFLRNTAWGGEYKINPVDPKTKEKFPHTFDLSTLKTKDFKLVADENGEFPYVFKKSNKKISFKFLNKIDQDELENIEKSSKENIPQTETKKLEKLIKSVEGNRDQMFIYQFIQSLPIKDSQDFKKFVEENKPGLDLIQEVKTPSGDIIQITIGFGVEFFRPFFGV